MFFAESCTEKWVINTSLNSPQKLKADVSKASSRQPRLGWVSSISRPTRYIIGHFGDESSPAINYTGTDNEKVTNLTKHAPRKQK